MKKSDVTLGQVYAVKVSGRIQPVRLVAESPYGGWLGRNEKTGREVRIKSAAKLRYRIPPMSEQVNQIKNAIAARHNQDAAKCNPYSDLPFDTEDDAEFQIGLSEAGVPFSVRRHFVRNGFAPD